MTRISSAITILSCLSLSISLFCISFSSADTLVESNYDFVSERKIEMKPPSQEGLDWILANLSILSPKVLLELKNQVMLRSREFSLNENDWSLIIDGSGSKWSGFWAVVVIEDVPTFQTTTSYYIEMNRDQTTFATNYGRGFGIGMPLIRHVREELAEQNVLDFKRIEISDLERRTLSGIWVSNRGFDNIEFNNCFNLNYQWEENELDDSVFLSINSDLSCEIVLPYNGTSRNSWLGVIQGIKADKWNFLTLKPNEPNSVNLDFMNSKFVFMSDPTRLVISQNNRIFEFHRKMKSPVFNVNTLQPLSELRVGVLKIKPSTE